MSNLKQHNRRSIRLPDYNYSLEGAYAITIVTNKHLCIFGNVSGGKVILNAAGNIAFDQWMQLGKRFPRSSFSPFVIMPNHVHGIISIGEATNENLQGGNVPLPAQDSSHVSINSPGSLGVIVRAYKASVTFRINALHGCTVPPVWQRNYYERVIRSEKELARFWGYIEANPERWEGDQFHS